MPKKVRTFVMAAECRVFHSLALATSAHVLVFSAFGVFVFFVFLIFIIVSGLETESVGEPFVGLRVFHYQQLAFLIRPIIITFNLILISVSLLHSAGWIPFVSQWCTNWLFSAAAAAGSFYIFSFFFFCQPANLLNGKFLTVFNEV